MNKYNGLLTEIAKNLHISQGDTEKEIEYKCRIIYSAVGRLAYASLLDLLEEDVPVSVTHFKRRIEKSMGYYLNIYSETEALIPNTAEIVSEFSEEMYELFLKTGQFYHSPHRLSPAVYEYAAVNNILFTRGAALADETATSGLGTYRHISGDCSEIYDVIRMFGLAEGKFYSYWKSVISNANWRTSDLSCEAEYLNHDLSYVMQYWIDQAIQDGTVSMMRTKDKALYYLYKFENNKLFVHQLPDWQTQNEENRALTNGCLYSYGKLPASTFRIDGNLVYFNIGYLYPPAEMNFIKLYSWPKHFSGKNKVFCRVFSKEVFFSIKIIFETIGYIFVEE